MYFNIIIITGNRRRDFRAKHSAESLGPRAVPRQRSNPLHRPAKTTRRRR